MANIYVRTFSRKGPDVLSEELALIFSKKGSFEFKPLFDILFASLRVRNLANSGEEMMRLRIYEKLQGLVSMGVVKKTVTNVTTKTYMGIPAPLRVLSKQLKAFRDEWTARVALKSANA
jgi:hypothetical protein